MSEKKYNIIQITKDFLADHEPLGYVQAYWKYFHPEITWHLSKGRVLKGVEAAVSAITLMDTLHVRPYAKMECPYIAQVDENTVMLIWIENIHNKDTGRSLLPYSITGENLFVGLVPTIFVFKDGLIYEKRSYYDAVPYKFSHAVAPINCFTRLREKAGEKYDGE